jgi:hypothetical protein
MSSQAHITELPRELRDMIYDEIIGTGGYLHNPSTGKLSQADGSPVSLRLTLTCKQIHAEMYDYTFRNRPITFKLVNPIYHKSVPRGGFGELSYLQREEKAWLLDDLCGLITDDIYHESLRCYPDFGPFLNQLTRTLVRHGVLSKRWGEAPSIQTYFIRYAISLIASRYNFKPKISWSEEVQYYWVSMSRVAKNLIGSNLMPWDIPSEQQLRNMYELLEPYLGLYLWDQGDWNRYK